MSETKPSASAAPAENMTVDYLSPIPVWPNCSLLGATKFSNKARMPCRWRTSDTKTTLTRRGNMIRYVGLCPHGAQTRIGTHRVTAVAGDAIWWQIENTTNY